MQDAMIERFEAVTLMEQTLIEKLQLTNKHARGDGRNGIDCLSAYYRWKLTGKKLLYDGNTTDRKHIVPKYEDSIIVCNCLDCETAQKSFLSEIVAEGDLDCSESLPKPTKSSNPPPKPTKVPDERTLAAKDRLQKKLLARTVKKDTSSKVNPPRNSSSSSEENLNNTKQVLEEAIGPSCPSKDNKQLKGKSKKKRSKRGAALETTTMLTEPNDIHLVLNVTTTDQVKPLRNESTSSVEQLDNDHSYNKAVDCRLPHPKDNKMPKAKPRKKLTKC